MRDRDIGFLPVCDGENLLGVLSDRDITIGPFRGHSAGGQRFPACLERFHFQLDDVWREEKVEGLGMGGSIAPPEFR